MSQSNAIAGALALAFLVFITLRGELPNYLRLFKPNPHKATPTASGGGGGGGGGGGSSSTADTVKTAIEVAKIAAMFA